MLKVLKKFTKRKFISREKRRKLKNAIYNLLPRCTGQTFSKFVQRLFSFKFIRFLRNTFLGFVGGVFLTYILLLVMIFQMGVGLLCATWFGSFFGIGLTIGLSFSAKFRCFVLLILPQFFSKKGRVAVVGYAFVLTLTGPATNTTKNIKVLISCLSCGQQQLSDAMKGLIEIMKRPFVAIKNAIKHIVKVVQNTMQKVKVVLNNIKELAKKILNAIQSSFNWLGSIVNMCNKKVGTPFERCSRAIDNVVDDCKKQLGFLEGICDIGSIIKTLCYAVKFLDLICMALDFINDSIIGVVRRRIDEFIKEIEHMFDISIQFDHHFSFKTNASKNMSQIHQDIVMEVKGRTDNLFFFFNVVSIISGILFLMIILKALQYKRKFLTRDRFDNHYINSDFVTIDEQRQSLEMETILPLTWRERGKYIRIWSVHLVWREKLRVARSAVFLMISSVHLGTFLITDYSLFWILSTIRRIGKKEKSLEMPPAVKLGVSGEGMLGDMYRGMFKAFDPMTDEYSVDPIPCLPDPYLPNTDRYVEIVGLLLLCWVLLIFEPYGLRLRQIVMCQYYPQRARERALWLYNNIIRKRSSFFKIARRQARRMILKDKAGVHKENFGVLDYIRAKYGGNIIVKFIFGKTKDDMCALCGRVLGKDQDVIQCMTPGCSGKFCFQCFKEINGKCFLCHEPLEYGDSSDYSEEKGSSSDEDKTPKATEGLPRPWKIKRKRLKLLRKGYDLCRDCDGYIFDILEEYED